MHEEEPSTNPGSISQHRNACQLPAEAHLPSWPHDVAAFPTESPLKVCAPELSMLFGITQRYLFFQTTLSFSRYLTYFNCIMDAHARSSGALSCSGSHLSHDSRACFVHLVSRPARLRTCKFASRAFVDASEPVSASVKHDQGSFGASRHRLYTEEADLRRSHSSDGPSILHAHQSRNIARAAGFAAVSIAALLHPSDAQASELLPLDLFSSFLVGMHALIRNIYHICLVNLAGCALTKEDSVKHEWQLSL